MNTSQRCTSSQLNTLASFMHSATVKEKHSPMGLAPQKLTGVTPKENLQNMDPTTHQVDPCPWKLTDEANSSSTTPHVDACSWKLTGRQTHNQLYGLLGS